MATFQPKKGTVHLWSRQAQRPARVADCLAGDMTVRYHDNSNGNGPDRADYYIVDSLSTASEREAVRLHALPVVLPEATDWLSTKIAGKVAAGQDVTLAMRREPR